MDTLVSYLIRSLVISGLMLGYYLTVLRNRKFHSFNRVWLLMSLLASLMLPLIRVGWLTWRPATQSPAIILVGTHRAAAKAFPTWTVVLLASAGVSAVLLSILVIRILAVYRLKRVHQSQRIAGCVLIEVQDRRAPFSFLKNLFWQEGADLHDPVNQKIFDHELAHIRGGHTYDTLFVQALAAVLWINPFYWLIRRELQMVHEFIADDASIASGDTETFARMLLGAYDSGRYLDPSHSFYFSPIKRRLRMINSSKQPSRWRLAMALPVLLAVMALACSKEQNASAAAPARIIPDQGVSVTGTKMRVDSMIRVNVLSLTKDAVKGSGGLYHITLDTLGQKVKLDLNSSDRITIVGKADGDKVPPPPPPPPPKVESPTN